MTSPVPSATDAEYIRTLDAIQHRALWLATMIVHHANTIRPNPDMTKVGGHQSSSASIISILTVLYLHVLRHGDRIAIKPQSSPSFHALQYLLGRLRRDYLTTLRAYRGLQAYPSRTKDPDCVDFSTGSVGLGVVAPAFGAMVHRYAAAHFGQVTSNRFFAVVGDGELDEGCVWEAILDESLAGLSNLVWVVDLNRQSLDRVVPGIRATRLKRLFEDHGWQVLEAKYGHYLQALFQQPGGLALRQRIDGMNNEEYQALIRLSGEELRPRLIRINGHEHSDLANLLRTIPDGDLPRILANLGGHDIGELLTVFEQIDDRRPTVIFAYTVKGWGLPIAGHPLNHAMLLTQTQIDAFRERCAISEDAIWDRFDPGTPEGQLCAQAFARLYEQPDTPCVTLTPDDIPHAIPIPTQGSMSTQDAFGRLLVRIADIPNLAPRIVTTSPDVSFSTNLAGWINKTGVFSPQELPDYESEAYRLMQWKRTPTGQHIELGISEMNLFMALGMLGLSAELCGQSLIPIGTVYDPFICRGLDAFIYALYSEAKFLVVGTPSGISLAPEGGAHQSTVTPSLGVELPNLNTYEPCFAQELEWVVIEALRQCCDRTHGRATYLRLSTKPIDQGLLAPAVQRLGAERLREQVLAGGYRLVDWRADAPDLAQSEPLPPLVHIVTAGTMIPEAVAAASYLHQEGIGANVINIVSQRRLFDAWQQLRHAQIAHPDAPPPPSPFDWLFPPDERHAPIITVLDGASHSLGWLGGIYGALVVALGVDSFGQSGTRPDLYRHYGIDVDHIVESAFSALDIA